MVATLSFDGVTVVLAFRAPKPEKVDTEAEGRGAGAVAGVDVELAWNEPNLKGVADGVASFAGLLAELVLVVVVVVVVVAPEVNGLKEKLSAPASVDEGADERAAPKKDAGVIVEVGGCSLVASDLAVS